MTKSLRLQRGIAGRPDQRGLAVAEFGLVFPIFVLITFAIIEIGFGLFNKYVLSNAAAKAARAATVYKNAKLGSEAQTLVTSEVTAYCASNLITFGSSNTPVATATWSPSVGSSSTVPFLTKLTVTVSYQYNGLILPRLLGLTGNALTLSEAVIMYNE